MRIRNSDNTRLIVTAGAASACYLLLVLGASDAYAAGAQNVGTNIGNLLRGWAQSIFGGVIALFSLFFLFGRRYSDLAVFVCAGIVVGGLVFATGPVTKMIRAIFQAIAA